MGEEVGCNRSSPSCSWTNVYTRMFPVIRKLSYVLIIIVVATTTESCVNKTLDDTQEENTMPTKTIEQALREHTDSLMAIPGVIGVGQGLCDNQDCIKVLVIKLTPALKQQIPKVLDGYRVDVEVTGEIKPLEKN